MTDLDNGGRLVTREAGYSIFQPQTQWMKSPISKMLENRQSLFDQVADLTRNGVLDSLEQVHALPLFRVALGDLWRYNVLPVTYGSGKTSILEHSQWDMG